MAKGEGVAGLPAGCIRAGTTAISATIPEGVSDSNVDSEDIKLPVQFTLDCSAYKTSKDYLSLSVSIISIFISLK